MPKPPKIQQGHHARFWYITHGGMKYTITEGFYSDDKTLVERWLKHISAYSYDDEFSFRFLTMKYEESGANRQAKTQPNPSSQTSSTVD